MSNTITESRALGGNANASFRYVERP